MPSFTPIERRLVLRYNEGRAFSFNQLLTNAGNEGLMDLANAISSIQDQAPRKITTVLTLRVS